MKKFLALSILINIGLGFFIYRFMEITKLKIQYGPDLRFYNDDNADYTYVKAAGFFIATGWEPAFTSYYAITCDDSRNIKKCAISETSFRQDLMYNGELKILDGSSIKKWTATEILLEELYDCRKQIWKIGRLTGTVEFESSFLPINERKGRCEGTDEVRRAHLAGWKEVELK